MKCEINIIGNRIFLNGNFPTKSIRHITSYPVVGAHFVDSFKKGFWDGRKHLFDLKTNSCPSGFLDLILEELRKHKDLEIEIKDQRAKFKKEIPKDFDLEGKLKGKFGKGKFDFQFKAFRKCVENQSGILKIATNGGKTSIGAAIIKHFDLKSLFIVPGIDLMYQTKDTLEDLLNTEVGVLGDGKEDVKKVTVAVVDSLHSKLKKGKIKEQWEVLIVDECHQAGSGTCYEVLDLLQSSIRIGMSGTPLDREDEASLRLIGQTGPVIYEIKNKLLVERGISVQPIVKFLTVDEPKIPKTRKVNGKRTKVTYSEAYKEGILENSKLNESICKSLKGYLEGGKQCVVIITYKKHGELIENTLAQIVTQPIKYMDGSIQGEERKSILDRFRSGEIRCLIGTSILNTGIDMNCIDVMCLPTGGKSTIQALQRIGRGLRAGKGREKLIIIDVVNLCHHFFAKHAKIRMDIYKREECFILKTIEDPD